MSATQQQLSKQQVLSRHAHRPAGERPTPEERELLEAWWEAFHPFTPMPEDELGRPMFCTVFPGAYRASGAIVTVNGSPVRLIGVVDFHSDEVWLLRPGHAPRTLSGQKYKKHRELQRLYRALRRLAETSLELAKTQAGGEVGLMAEMVADLVGTADGKQSRSNGRSDCRTG